MNNCFNFDDWFATVIPTHDAPDRQTVRSWLVASEFNTLLALQLLEKKDMPVDWPVGRKRAIYASRPGGIAQGKQL